MNTRELPLLSVIMVTPDHYDTLRTTIGYLRAQTIHNLLEVVIVAPSVERLSLDESELAPFHSFQVVEVVPFGSAALARAEGIRAAKAPLVALTEDHCYPEPEWAAALVKAHEGPWAAVGPVIGNANPASMTSWANLLVEYGPWLDPMQAGEVDHLPGHNSSYKREMLLQYGPTLEVMLEAESTLHWDLRDKGARLYLEPAAKARHLSYSRASFWLQLRFHAGRVFAAARARSWPARHRILYVLGGPLIPWVRLWRIVRELRRPGRPRHLLPGILPSLIAGLLIDGLGEMLGYASGAGDSLDKVTDAEFDRARYLTEEDVWRITGRPSRQRGKR